MPRGRIRWGAAVLVAAALCLAPAPAFAGSPRVAALQAALQAKGLYTAEVDGVPGPMTRAATMRFQRRKRLTVDGVAGPRTHPRPRQPRPSATRQPRARPAARRLGRGGRAVPALAERLLSRRHRRRLRPRHGAGRLRLPALDGPRSPTAWRAPRRSAPCAAGRGGHPYSPVRFFRPLAGSDGRRLRSHRRPPPHGHRLPGAGRHARQGGRQGRGGPSPAGTRAATATSSWSSTGSASPAGTPTSAASWPGPVRPSAAARCSATSAPPAARRARTCTGRCAASTLRSPRCRTCSPAPPRDPALAAIRTSARGRYLRRRCAPAGC